MNVQAMSRCSVHFAAHSSCVTRQQRSRLVAAAPGLSRHAFRTQQPRHARLHLQPVRAEGKDGRQSTAEKEDELPPWLRKEKMQKLVNAEGGDGLPFGLYLLGSALVAIAAVGSVFELINQNPIFGVVYPGNPLYTPILGFFAVSGFPTTGFLFLKGVEGANKLSERLDKVDGK